MKVGRAGTQFASQFQADGKALCQISETVLNPSSLQSNIANWIAKLSLIGKVAPLCLMRSQIRARRGGREIHTLGVGTEMNLPASYDDDVDVISLHTLLMQFYCSSRASSRTAYNGIFYVIPFIFLRMTTPPKISITMAK